MNTSEVMRSLGIGQGSRVAVSGCGGKTSVINSFARESADSMSVLITPTTKIRPERSDGVYLATTREECLAHVPRRGIQCLGVLNAETGKLEALPPDDLSAIVPRYDLALMEADGSRGLPCKGWTDMDPVIPEFATHTIGVVSIKAVGLPASEDNVFRPGEFLKLTGMKRGEPITIRALALMIVSREGMFRKKSGAIAVVINQAESPASMEMSAELAEVIRGMDAPAPRKIFAGSVMSGEWTEL